LKQPQLETNEQLRELVIHIIQDVTGGNVKRSATAPAPPRLGWFTKYRYPALGRGEGKHTR